MHERFYNELILKLMLRPRTPLLIKSGASTGLDPSLPEMQFVRTRWATKTGETEETMYIPGSSLRGVIRSHAERLVRSVNLQQACDPLQMKGDDRSPEPSEMRGACLTERTLKGKIDKRPDKLNGAEAWKFSCYTCRLFGNTGLAARARIGDLYPMGNTPITQVRHGVAIDRITGAVAQGPFQMETVTDGDFSGEITLRNFTIGQLGLLAAALLDMGDGLVALGYAKSRGMGRVELFVEEASFRFCSNPDGKVKGLGALMDEAARAKYGLGDGDDDSLPLPANVATDTGKTPRLFQTITMRDWDKIKELLERAVPFWVKQLEA